MNVYRKRLIALLILDRDLPGSWVARLSAQPWNNQYTLSKLILWALDSRGAVFFVGLIFMVGFLFGHLDSPQDSILGPAAEDLKKVLITNLAGQVGPLIAIDRVSAQAFVDEVETMKS